MSVTDKRVTDKRVRELIDKEVKYADMTQEEAEAVVVWFSARAAEKAASEARTEYLNSDLKERIAAQINAQDYNLTQLQVIYEDMKDHLKAAADARTARITARKEAHALSKQLRDEKRLETLKLLTRKPEEE